ncbi:MAG TPA: DNA polymerase III subunit chi [Moraxellaceae bacterium]|nr:DNA polymerase III subunit chi [Moraxellaceae bacterium]
MEITFYVLADTDPGKRLLTACRIVEKAFQQKHQVYIQAGSRTEAEQLDELLWNFRPESFIPHHLVGEGPTPPPPVRIGWLSIPPEARDLVVNLGDEAIPDPRRFRRLIEIVGGSDTQREPARQHWRHYKQQGYAVTSHNL